MSNITRERFARKLCSLYDTFGTPDFDIETFSAEVMHAFLEFGSNTPDHRQCSELIEFGPVLGSWVTSFGIKVKGKPVLVRDILYFIESLPMPDEVKEAYPDLEIEEWEAVMRMATMIISAFVPFLPREET